MIIDIEGNKRYKINLHTHTTRSDGRVSPEKSAQIYKAAGYDMIAFTDHWIYNTDKECEGLKLIPGCEYNVGAVATDPIVHILGIGAETEPIIDKENATAQSIIDGINKAGGIAILAHPAWSLEQPSEMMNLSGIFTTEIFNTVSDMGANIRGYSGAFVDLSACLGKYYMLTAADDTHFYVGEETVSSIMVKSESDDIKDIMAAIKAGDYYATQGPQLIVKREGNKIIADTSPVCKISFFSDAAYSKFRVVTGENITHAEYYLRPFEKFVRAEAYDKDGKAAWSQIIKLK